MKKILVLVLLLYLFQSCAEKDEDSLPVQFDSVFKDSGGRLEKMPEPYTNMQSFTLDFGNQIIAWVRKNNHGLPDAYVDIINDSRLNAISRLDYEGKYFIGINFGTLIILQDAFFRMLSSKNVLTDIGDTSKEISPAKIKSLQVKNIEDFKAERDDTKDREAMDALRSSTHTRIRQECLKK